MKRYINDKSKTQEEIQDEESIMYMGVGGTTEGDNRLSRFYPAELALYIEENGGLNKVWAE